MASGNTELLEARAIEFTYGPDAPALGPLSFAVRPGQLVGVLGPNGAGTSTLMRLAVGLQRPTCGEVLLAGRPIREYSAQARAQRIAFLPQHPEAPGSTTAEEIVRLGRHPFRGWGIFESALDLRVVQEAMRRTATLGFAQRRMDTLSGGESQRVHLASALAQQPKLLVLDEPTADLDLRHQLQIFVLLKKLTREDGLAAIVVTHDVNLAAQFCDIALVLNQGRMALSGSPVDVLQPERLSEVYGVRFHAVPIPGREVPGLLALESTRPAEHEAYGGGDAP
jgi:iron complex transport system ATP-binding protein